MCFLCVHYFPISPEGSIFYFFLTIHIGNRLSYELLIVIEALLVWVGTFLLFSSLQFVKLVVAQKGYVVKKYNRTGNVSCHMIHVYRAYTVLKV